MKTCLKSPFPLLVLITGLGLITAGRVIAQTFTILHSFTAISGSDSTNSDGAAPYGGLILSGNTLYGTANKGGSLGGGTVFKVNIDGTGFTNLYSFTAISASDGTNSDGARPYGSLISSGTTLYGTAAIGGNSGNGTVFAVNTNGTGFTNLHIFTATSADPPFSNSDGAGPSAGLILSGKNLYGTAGVGGAYGNGTVFMVSTNGTGFATVYSFTPLVSFQNDDGANPSGVLILSSNTLYGGTEGGGNWGNGTLFAVNTDGTGFTNLHSFTATKFDASSFYINDDGTDPPGGLILSSNVLYGGASGGGAFGNGTVFAVNTDGASFTVLHTFFRTPYDPPRTNSEGAVPHARLILSGNMLYGTTVSGGIWGKGTVFAVRTDGTGFTDLFDFSGGSDGAEPFGGSILSDNTLYGTTASGGSSGFGTIFSIVLRPRSPPQLTITASSANVILTWPTNSTGFTLQSTTNLMSSAVWTAVSPGPGVVNGQNAMTNPISGIRKFYRLSQ